MANGTGFVIPAAIADQREKAAERFFIFVTDTFPNAKMRAAYYRNTTPFFSPGRTAAASPCLPFMCPGSF